jgi:NAD(P)-dependent dehydrogenase (short-subunit alcohol dehydrogenase family)
MTQENLDVIVRETKLTKAEALARILAASPQKRLLEPEEVAAAVAHLASPKAQGINGQAITIDGGAVQW